jgi:hypothetical protein
VICAYEDKRTVRWYPSEGGIGRGVKTHTKIHTWPLLKGCRRNYDEIVVRSVLIIPLLPVSKVIIKTQLLDSSSVL